MSILQKNPVTMLGRITRCWLLTYSTPEEQARYWLGPRLEPLTKGGFAFWNVVVCELAHMRPSPLPAFLGVSYRHAAYRLYVKFRAPSGELIGGLHFVRSDADSKLIAAAGNRLTDYHFFHSRVLIEESADLVHLEVVSPKCPGRAILDRATPPSLREGSPFDTLEEAEEFLKYEPAGIGVAPDGEVNVVRISRDEAAWNSHLVTIAASRWQLFETMEVHPEICYEVQPIDYRWNRAEIYRP